MDSFDQTIESPFPFTANPDSPPPPDVHHYLASELRKRLLPLPCNPDTPEARGEREAALMAVAMSLNPETHAEAVCAIRFVAADAHQAQASAELAEWRNDPYWTGKLRAQSNSLGREASGALNALAKLQRDRLRMTEAQRDAANAAGHNMHQNLMAALQAMPPPPPPPDPRPAAAAEPRTARRAAATPDPLEKTDAYAAMRKVFGVPLIMRPPAPL
ncbi:MAG TPA: hypothetical protein VMU81_30550, partial [Acetobacteraceae bacterium]|nr:hypothetical protein [Acetobacteraceae bacterium]